MRRTIDSKPALSRKEKRASLALHEADGALAAAHREKVATIRGRRELGRERRKRKAAEERQRFIDQIIGAGYREAQAKPGRQRQRGAVAGFVKLFAMERRNDFSAEAVAAVLNSEHYPVEEVAERLAELKAAGDFDRIIAEARPSD